MELFWSLIRENYLTVLLVAVLLFGGAAMEMFVFPRIRKNIKQDNPFISKVIIRSLRGISFSIALAIGIIILLNRLEIPDPYGRYIHNGLLVMLVLLITWLISRIVITAINHSTDKENSEFSGATIFENVFKIVTYLLGILVALQVIGIPIAPIVTALGVGGLAVALALQDTLSNLFSGLNIIASRKLRPGDFIKLQSGEEGFVEDINWRTTTLRETADNIIVIPNSKLAGAIHKNYNLPDREVIVGVMAVVSYQNDFNLVEKLALESAKESIAVLDFCVKEQEPAFRWQQFNDTGMQFSVFLKMTEYNMLGILRHEFLKRFLLKCNENKIQFPQIVPMRTIN
jgi:small-conductance mechanosensitive channel